jgi:hypothetical protein
MSFQVSDYQPDNLAQLLSERQDKGLAPSYDMSGLSYDEAMNYAPTALTRPVNLDGMGEASSLNPVFYVLGAAALAYIFFMKKEQSFGY